MPHLTKQANTKPREVSSTELPSKEVIMHVRVTRAGRGRKPEPSFIYQMEGNCFAICAEPQEQVGSIKSRGSYYKKWRQNSDTLWQTGKAAGWMHWVCYRVHHQLPLFSSCPVPSPFRPKRLLHQSRVTPGFTCICLLEDEALQITKPSFIRVGPN